MAESHTGGCCDRAEVVHCGPCRGRSELQIGIHDAIGESDLRQGELRGGTESQADELLLEREGLLRVLEQERLVGDPHSAERLSQILDNLLRTVFGKSRHPPQVRLMDEGEPFVHVDRAPCPWDLRRRLLPPEMEEVDRGMEHLVGIHGMRQGSPRNESSVPIRSTFGHLAEPLYTADSSGRTRRETDTPREREFCEGRTGAPCPGYQPGAWKQSERARDRAGTVELPERLPRVAGHGEAVDREEARGQPGDPRDGREQDFAGADARRTERESARPHRERE